MARDNFSAIVVASLRKRSGERCSNPSCTKLTAGPNTDSARSISIGVAAHIAAASPGGPRYKQYMSSRERKSIDNAIWLCQNCAKLIDSDTAKFTEVMLLCWKELSENRASAEISSTTLHSDSSLTQPIADHPAREIIELGDNNCFHGDSEDIQNLATRCAIAAINGVQIRFEARLLPIVLVDHPSDPLSIPRYEKWRAEKAKELSRLLNILTAPSVQKWWSYTLRSVEDWILCIEALLARASVTWSEGGGHKLDVWRTEEPRVIAAVYLADDELQLALKHMGLNSTQELRFGPYWRSASDLPREQIIKHVIPRLIFELDRRQLAPEGSVLNLLEWHIGDG